MTPALVELARAYVATEGPLVVPASLLNNNDCIYSRAMDGTLWVNLANECAPEPEWLPDLRDAATGGVMLVHHGVISTDRGGRKNQPSFGVFLKWVGWFYGASYGEAVAKAHVAKAKKEGA